MSARSVRSTPPSHRPPPSPPTITSVPSGARARRRCDSERFPAMSHLRRALAPEGTLVIVGGEGGGRWLGGVDRTLRALVLSPFARQKLGTWIATQPKEDLEALRELLEAGKVTPVVDRTFPLTEVPEAIRYLRDGRARGKVVITVSGAT